MEVDQQKLKRFAVISVVVVLAVYLFHMIPVAKNIEHKVMKDKHNLFSGWKLLQFLYYVLAVLVGLYAADYLLANELLNV